MVAAALGARDNFRTAGRARMRCCIVPLREIIHHISVPFARGWVLSHPESHNKYPYTSEWRTPMSVRTTARRAPSVPPPWARGRPACPMEPVALMSHVAGCRPLYVGVLPASTAVDVAIPCSSRNRPCASSTRCISSRNRAMKPSRPGSSVSRTTIACLTASLNSLAAAWSA